MGEEDAEALAQNDAEAVAMEAVGEVLEVDEVEGSPLVLGLLEVDRHCVGLPVVVEDSDGRGLDVTVAFTVEAAEGDPLAVMMPLALPDTLAMDPEAVELSDGAIVSVALEPAEKLAAMEPEDKALSVEATEKDGLGVERALALPEKLELGEASAEALCVGDTEVVEESVGETLMLGEEVAALDSEAMELKEGAVVTLKLAVLEPEAVGHGELLTVALKDVENVGKGETLALLDALCVEVGLPDVEEESDKVPVDVCVAVIVVL